MTTSLEVPSHHGVVVIPERVALRALHNAVPVQGGCNLSLYSRGSHGYAQIGWHEDKARATTAHRAAWVGWHGQQVPDGFDIDHTCRNRPCVNPHHLRLLGWHENASDGARRGAVAGGEATRRKWASVR